MSRKRGRPRRWASPEAMQAAIDAYFKDCDGHIVIGFDGYAVTNRKGIAIMEGARAPTVTGLALALGFTSRQALLNYQDVPQYQDILTRAKMRVEAYAESRLYDNGGNRGAMFTLIQNFGWTSEILDAPRARAMESAHAKLPKAADAGADV